MYKSLSIREKILIPFGIGLIAVFVVLYWVLVTYAMPNSTASGRNVLIVSLAVIFVLTMIGTWNISRLVLKPIRNLSASAVMLAEGDMHFSVDIDSGREMRQLGDSFREVQSVVNRLLAEIKEFEKGFETGDLSKRADDSKYQGDYREIAAGLNAIMDSVSTLVKNVRDSSALVSTSATEISSGAMNLAQGATEQASSIEEISATVDDMASFMKNTSEHALSAKQMIVDIQREAETGSTNMNRLLSALNDINVSSANISSIIKTIEDIAFQTNILALNAAVEAARAGAAGKGFAIVASEVKNLASKSAKAAQETNELLGGNIIKARDGLSIGEDMSAFLGNIVSRVGTTAETITEIAADSKHQSETVEQINTGLGQISNIVQNNTATAEQSASSSQEMAAQASLLRELVAKYRFSDDEASSWSTGNHTARRLALNRAS